VNRTPIEWDGYTPPVPAQCGSTGIQDYDIAELREYIDWQPLFTLGDEGQVPRHPNNPVSATLPASCTTTPRRCSTP